MVEERCALHLKNNNNLYIVIKVHIICCVIFIPQNHVINYAQTFPIPINGVSVNLSIFQITP